MYFVRYTKEIYYHTRLFLEKKVLSRSWYFISIFSEHIFIFGSSFNLRMITCLIIYAKILSKVIWSLYSLNCQTKLMLANYYFLFWYTLILNNKACWKQRILSSKNDFHCFKSITKMLDRRHYNCFTIWLVQKIFVFQFEKSKWYLIENDIFCSIFQCEWRSKKVCFKFIIIMMYILTI